MKRTSSVVLEQAAVSLSSGLLLISLVRTTPLQLFGALSLTYVIVQLTLAMIRYALFIPLHTTDPSTSPRVLKGRALVVLTAVLGLFVAPTAFGATTFTLGYLFPEAAAVALCAPLLFVNEALRQTALSANRVPLATVAALSWLAFSVSGFLIGSLEYASSIIVIGFWSLGLLISIIFLSFSVILGTNLRGPRHVIKALSRRQSQTGSTTRPNYSYIALGIGIPSSILLLQLAVATSAGANEYGLLAVNALAWTPMTVWLAALPVLTRRQVPRLRESPTSSRWASVLLVFAPPLVWAGLLTILVPKVGPFFLGAQSAVVASLIPITTLSFVVFLAQQSALLAIMRVDDRRGITWTVVGAVASRTLVSLALLMIGNVSLEGYILAEALCHGVIALILGGRRVIISRR